MARRILGGKSIEKKLNKLGKSTNILEDPKSIEAIKEFNESMEIAMRESKYKQAMSERDAEQVYLPKSPIYNSL